MGTIEGPGTEGNLVAPSSPDEGPEDDFPGLPADQVRPKGRLMPEWHLLVVLAKQRLRSRKMQGSNSLGSERMTLQPIPHPDLMTLTVASRDRALTATTVSLRCHLAQVIGNNGSSEPGNTTVIEPAVETAGYQPILSAAEELPNAINDEIRAHLRLILWSWSTLVGPRQVTRQIQT